jgi:UrcA family protein
MSGLPVLQGRKKMSNRFSIALLSAILMSAASLPASAQAHSVAVTSSDLNLTSDAGRTTLQMRIAHAVDAVCGPAHARTTADSDAYAKCSKTARADAQTQYDTMVAKAMDERKIAATHKATLPVE